MLLSRNGLIKSLSLLAIGFLESFGPFLRMLCLSHLLTLDELGLTSALTAVAVSIDQVTDIALYRFVISCKREELEDALEGAHAVSLIRGLALGVILFLLAPAFARFFGRESEWLSFAFLGAIAITRSTEHIEPRAAEGDFSYEAQLKVTAAANFASLSVLLVAAIFLRNHFALLISLLTSALVTSIMSARVSTHPYRARIWSPYGRKAWSFGYPLMVNGAGLAITGQGDRMLVGALLGLPLLGVYSVAILFSTVPISILTRIMNTVQVASFRNAKTGTGQFEARLRLFAGLTPLIAGFYALGLLEFMNPLVALVFGDVFVVDKWILSLLALGAFFKIARTEPFTALLLHEAKTKALAGANLSTMSGLALGTLWALWFKTLLSPLLGRLFGEALSLFVTLRLTRDLLRSAKRQFSTSFIGALLMIFVAIVAMQASPPGNLHNLTTSWGLFACLSLALTCWAGFILSRLYNLGFSRTAAEVNL